MPCLQSLAAAPVRTRTYRHLLYLGLTFHLGVACFVVLVIGFSISASLIVLIIGLPLLALTLLIVRGLAAVERLLANRLLDTDIAAPAYPFRTGSVPDRLRALLLNRRTWIECSYLLSKFPAGVSKFVFLVAGLTTSLAFGATPVYYDNPGQTCRPLAGRPGHRLAVAVGAVGGCSGRDRVRRHRQRVDR